MFLTSPFWILLASIAKSSYGLNILGIVSAVLGTGNSGPQVQVEQGTLEGACVSTFIHNKNYYSFKGIPYAKPPVGSLRFKDPQPVEPWTGVRAAVEHGSICPQVNMLLNVYLPGSEDCLFLNVYSPNITTGASLPVVVFIHGGVHRFGSGNDDNYGPDFFMLNDVVLVTINYRLDALGFLSLGTKDVPGNAALKDQNLALQWVQRNIAKFGGDPDNVTLMGQSSGSASVTFHLLSPKSKGLFKRAVCLSGVNYNDFTTAHYPEQRALALAQSLGFETTNPNEVLECLQSVSKDKLVNTSSIVLESERATDFFVRFISFPPVVEKDVGQENIFFSEDPVEILNRGEINAEEVIIGYTTHEATTFIPFIKTYIPAYEQYPEMFVPTSVFYKSNSDTVLNLSSQIVNYFFGSKAVSDISMLDYVDFISNASLTSDIHRFARSLSNHKNVYFYKFGAETTRNFYAELLGSEFNIKGPAHLDDLFYYFNAKLIPMILLSNSVEYNMVSLCSGLLANFAKYGNPTPDNSLGITWSTYNSENLNYLDLTTSPCMKTGADEPHVQFLKGILEQGGIPWK